MNDGCIWNFGVDHIGEISEKMLSFPDGSKLSVSICDGCFEKHNRVIQISKDNNCNGERALKIFYEELNKENTNVK